MKSLQVLPIDDVIMPRIESGRWAAFPYSTSSNSNSNSMSKSMGGVTTTAGAVGGTADATADKFIYTAGSANDKAASASDQSESFKKRYKGAFMHQLPQVLRMAVYSMFFHYAMLYFLDGFQAAGAVDTLS